MPRKSISFCRFLSFGVVLALTVALDAGIAEPAVEIDGHLFLVSVEGELRPIVDADSRRVEVLLKEGEREWMRVEDYTMLEKSLPSVGRLTIYDEGGRTSQNAMGGFDSLKVGDSTSMEFDLVADRDLEDVYVALFFSQAGIDEVSVGFGSLGDLVGGERVRRSVRFSVHFMRTTKFWAEYYCGGSAIERVSFEEAATASDSVDLLIPWKDRLEQYRKEIDDTNGVVRPRPLILTLDRFYAVPLENELPARLSLSVKIHLDGTVRMLGLPDSLSDNALVALQADIAEWRFFPPAKEGKLIEAAIQIPLQLE